MAYFVLCSKDEQVTRTKLTAFSGAVKGTKLALTLKVEVEANDISYTLESLNEILAAHKRRGAKPVRKASPKPLMLPAPKDDEGSDDD